SAIVDLLDCFDRSGIGGDNDGGVVLIGQALGIACRCRRSILVVERLQLQCDGTAIDFDSVSIEVVDRHFEPDLHVFTVSGAATTEWPGVPDDNGVAVTGPLTTARGHRQSKCADCRRGQQLATAISRTEFIFSPLKSSWNEIAPHSFRGVVGDSSRSSFDMKLTVTEMNLSKSTFLSQWF